MEFIKFESAGKLGDSVRTGVWDVAFLGAEPQRAAEIAFTAAYLEIPSTYIVPAGSPIRSVDEVDREGVRIAVTEQSAYGLYLVRSVKHAKSRPDQDRRRRGPGVRQRQARGAGGTPAGAPDRGQEDPRRARARRPVHRRFSRRSAPLKNREAAAEFLRAFVEDVKASGLVAEAISRNGVQGVSVAPRRALGRPRRERLSLASTARGDRLGTRCRGTAWRWSAAE